MASSGSSSAETVVITVDGKEFGGDVVAAGLNTMRIKLEGGGYQFIPVRSISRVRVDINDSEPLEGTFLDWSDGEIVVRVGNRDFAIRDGAITSVFDVDVAAGEAVTSPPEQAPEEQLLPVIQLETPAEPEGTGDIAPDNATM